jgi:hypothetical protein
MAELSVNSNEGLTHSENALDNGQSRHLNLTRNQVEMWIVHRNERKTYLYKQTGNLFEYFVVVKISFLIAMIMTMIKKSKANYYYIFGGICFAWCAFYVIRILRLFLNLKIINDYTKRKHTWVTIAKNAFGVIGYLQIGIFCFIGVHSIAYSIMIPFAIQLMAPLVLKERSTNNCFSMIRALRFVVSLFRFIFTFLMLMIYMRKVEIPAPIIFIPLWLILFMLLISSLFLLCIIIMIGISIIKAKAFKQESIRLT